MSHHHHSHKPSPAAAVGSKTARPCDSCILRRARYYCAADDAFLCHPCDSVVHSANPLSRRHHRLPLRSSSVKIPTVQTPAWHHGFKRKPRTPRSHHKPVVPEIDSPVEEEEEEEEQLLYRVPVFDPAPAETEIDLAEFAANMESLLGREEAFCMEELGLGGRVEVKGEVEVDLSREPLELDYGCGSSEVKEEGKGMGLRLDYEAVKEAWMSIGSSPWMAGERPRVRAEDYWIECLGMWGGTGGEVMGGGGGEGGIQVMDVGREARVTRYREKRRTRLFSKKIRYEVRKLNAEKRPRMKGRFVKRASFPATVGGGGAGGGAAAFKC